MFVGFRLNTATRHREILRVRYDQIDFEAKAGEREQPITPALANMLRREQATQSKSQEGVVPICAIRAKRPYRGSMAVLFQRAVICAGLLPEEVMLYVMRHTAITRLVRARGDLPTIEKISGHKTRAMVLRYVHIHGQHINTAIVATANALLDVFTPGLSMSNAMLTD